MAHEGDVKPGTEQDAPDRPAGLALAAARADRADGHDWPRALQHACVRADQPEVGARSQRPRCLVHDLDVRKVGVGEHNLVDTDGPDELLQVGFWADGNARRVARAGERRRVDPVVDARDLRRGKCDNFDRRVVAEHDIEVVEVTPASSHDEHAACGCWAHHAPAAGRASIAALSRATQPRGSGTG